MSGGSMSDASFQQAVEEVRRKMPNVTTIVIEYLLRDVSAAAIDIRSTFYYCILINWVR